MRGSYQRQDFGKVNDVLYQSKCVLPKPGWNRGWSSVQIIQGAYERFSQP